jgi:4-hydroxy-3-polyprenylbenzoate decarboxylase
MNQQWVGQAKAVLFAALYGAYMEPKVAIAVDEDVNIFDARDIFWAVSTRVDPQRDVVVMPNQRIHPLDISAPVVSDPDDPIAQRVGGKMLIDATKPAAWRTSQRELFNRVVPSGAKDDALQGILKYIAASQ